MFALCRTAAIAAALVLTPAAFAAGVSSQAQDLMEQGLASDALQLLDTHLARNPQDAEARFTKGLALVRLERTQEAVRVFADLTRDYPQLPEPYNNLAVLYASQGDYNRAREALEAALATHPSYATAHENLGDIYAALAGAAYNRALLLDESNVLVRRKLALINQLEGSAPLEASAAVQVPAAAPVAPVAAEAAPARAVPTPAPIPAVAPAVTELDASARTALNDALLAWAAAWSAQDLDAYFAAYAPDFVPEGGLSRAAWEAQRRERIAQPRRISVKIADPRFQGTGASTATVQFRQDYASDSFNDVVDKMLDMTLTAGGWKIAREYAR